MRDRLKAAGRVARRSRKPLLIGAVSLLALVGVAGAAIPGLGDDEIDGCYQKTQGQLRVIDAEAGERCRASEVALAWNARGPAGPQGPAGETGPQGETGARGPSHAFSRFHDAEKPVWFDLSAPRLLELDVPAGSYVTTAKVVVRNAGCCPSTVHCVTRHPGGDSDVASTRLGGGQQPGDRQTLIMNLVGQSDGTSSIYLDCSGADGVMAGSMRITSIRVADVTNTPG